MTRACIAILATGLLAGCAQVKAPEGGPKDGTAPELLSAEPANGSVRFTGKRIVLHFSERIKLDRIRERLLISPPLAEDPAVAVFRGHDVVIDLRGPLLPNTTYTFNFGEAVKDLSEGNPAENLAYVLSTGTYVDSLSLTGRVFDARSGLPAKDVLVLLHDATDTGDVRTSPPDHFTRTGSDGRFKLTHLRAGAMQLNALLDRNANYRYDLPNEEIAFLGHEVDPAHAPEQELFLFRPQSATQFVAAAKVLNERGWRMVLARPAGKLALRSLDRQGGSLSWWPEWNTARDTVVFWPSDTTLLNGQRFVVSEDAKVLDTLTYRATGRMPFYLTLSAGRDPVSGDLFMRSSRPVAEMDSTHAVLRMDSTTAPLQFRLDTAARRSIGVDVRLPEGKSAALTLFPKAALGVMGGTNDTTELRFGARDPRTLGKLKVELKLDSGTTVEGPLVLQLRTAQGHVIREAAMDSLPGIASWTDLPPDTYGLRLIEDRDGNGRWSTGSFDPPRQPERIFLLKDPVQVRAGWAVETAWELRGHK